MIKSFWSRLDPKKQRIAAVVAGGAVVVGVVAMFSGPPNDSSNKHNGRQQVIRNVLTDKDTKSIGIDSLAANVKIVSGENELIQRELKKMQEELKAAKQSTDKSTDMNREVVRLRQEITNLNQKMGEMAKTVEEAKRNLPKNRATQQEQNDAAPDTFASGAGASNEQTEDPLFEKRDFSLGPKPAGEGGQQTERPRLKITSYSQRVEETVENAEDSDDNSLYLPAGSIITGTLINGMDAPTGQGARRDPFPSTLRIQKEAILPNRFRADIRECFLIIGGYGDLSSERGYLRGETLSCVREDGGVIEASLPSYAVGEDGKAGVRGRLVSKQGQIIAKSLIAGFMGGAAEAFDVNAVPTINTSSIGRTQYQEVMSPQLMQGAAVQGASKALDRIAQFYISMAEGIFPVIEIDAGRQIDIIVTKGTKLALKSKGEKAEK